MQQTFVIHINFFRQVAVVSHSYNDFLQHIPRVGLESACIYKIYTHLLSQQLAYIPNTARGRDKTIR